MTRVDRYHPLLASLHWLLAILIIAALILGYFVIAPMANSDPEKVGLLRVHMSVGMLILALTVLRFIVRMLTARPTAATTGNRELDRIAPITHYGFYVLILLMAGSGLAMAVASGLNLIVFGGSGAPLPPTLTIYPPRVAHGYIAALLAAFIALHVLAALYHQFLLRDRLFGRMGFGRRV